MTWRTPATLLVVGALAGAAACAGTGGPRRGSPFPTQASLDRLTQKPLSDASLGEGQRAPVDRWTLSGPFPAQIGEVPVASTKPWDEALLAAARSRAGLVVVSEPMRCAARELAAFLLEHDALPPHLLQNRLLGRCGATGTRVAVSWLSGDALPEQSDQQVLDQWRGQMKDLLAARSATGPQAAGIWLQRRGGRAVIVLVTSERRALVEPTAFTPDADGWIRISGEMLRPADKVSALITQGRLGYAKCKVDPKVVLPRFSIACPVAPDDDSAWVSLEARPPGRALFDTAFDLLVLPRGGEAQSWHRIDYGSSDVVSTPEELSERLLAEVNRIRAGQQMQPLTLEKVESKTAEKLAPYFFGSYYGKLDAHYGDEAALGLLAGWQVAGTIRRGQMGGAVVLATQKMDDLLAEAFQGPELRRVLLDPEVSRVAIGPLLSPHSAYLGAMVASWAIYTDEDPGKLRAAFYTRVAREFQHRELPLPRRESELEPLAERQASRLSGGAESTREALNALVNDSASSLHVRVRGWILQADSLDDIELPEDLFQGHPSRLVAAVGHYQPSGEPWGRTFVLLVAAPEPGKRSASLPRTPRG